MIACRHLTPPSPRSHHGTWTERTDPERQPSSSDELRVSIRSVRRRTWPPLRLGAVVLPDGSHRVPDLGALRASGPRHVRRPARGRRDLVLAEPHGLARVEVPSN